jgi:hypothetical protein
MRGIRVLIAVLAIAAGALAAGEAALAATGTALPVAPARGHLHTTFTVDFTAPNASGSFGGQTRSYELSATPLHAGRGCIDSVSMAPDATSAGEAIAVVLRPRHLGGRWCAGTYTGSVVEVGHATCGPIVAQHTDPDGVACPQYVAVLDRIGSFRFRVVR